MSNLLKKLIGKKLLSVFSCEIRDLKIQGEMLASEKLDIQQRLDRLEKQSQKLKRATARSYQNHKLVDMTIGGVWFYSLMKSGTTYTVNVLVNYMRLLMDGNSKPIDYALLIQFHSTHKKIDKNIDEMIESQKKLLKPHGYNSFIHTHKKIDSLSKKTILLSRNPLDYIVSKYFYIYKNRSKDVSITEVLPRLIKEFMVTYRDHRAIVDAEEDVLDLRYEDLIANPLDNFREMIDYLGLPYKEELLAKAIQYSSKKGVVVMENEKGSALLANTNSFKAKSFIRSGEIGDWKKHLSAEQKEVILSTLESKGFNKTLYQYE